MPEVTRPQSRPCRTRIAGLTLSDLVAEQEQSLLLLDRTPARLPEPLSDHHPAGLCHERVAGGDQVQELDTALDSAVDLPDGLADGVVLLELLVSLPAPLDPGVVDLVAGDVAHRPEGDLGPAQCSW